MVAVNVDRPKKSSEHQRQREEVPTPVLLAASSQDFHTILDPKNRRRRSVQADSSHDLHTMLDLKNHRRSSAPLAASAKDFCTILDRNREVRSRKYQRRRSIESLMSILGDSVTTSLLGGDSDATGILGSSVFGESVTARSYDSRASRIREDSSLTRNEQPDPSSSPRRIRKGERGSGHSGVFTSDGKCASRNSRLGGPSSAKKEMDPPPFTRQIRNGDSGKARTFTSDRNLPVVKRSDSSPTKKNLDPPSSTLPVHLDNNSNGHISRSGSPGSASTTLSMRGDLGSGHTGTFKSAKSDGGESSTKKINSALSTNGSAFAIKKTSSFSRDGSPVHVSTSRRPGCATAAEAHRSNSGSDHTRASKTVEDNCEASSTRKTYSSSFDDDNASATKKTSFFSPDCPQDRAPTTQAGKSNGKNDHACSIEKRKSIGSASARSFDCSTSVRYEVGDTRIHRSHSISFNSSTQASVLLAQLPLKYPLFVRRSNQKFAYSILVGRIDSRDDGGVSLVVALDEIGKLEKVVKQQKWVTCLRLVNSRMVNFEHY